MNNHLSPNNLKQSQKFNRARNKYFVIALLLSLLISFNVYKTLHSAEKNARLVNVMVATDNITAPAILNKNDWHWQKIRQDRLPVGAIVNPQDIAQQTTLINISKNQILVKQFFQDKTNPDSISAKISPSKVAIALGFDWLSAPIPNIKTGDYVDLIVSEAHKDTSKNILLAQAKIIIKDAKIIEINKKGDYNQNGYLALELTEDEAKNLMTIKALKVNLNIIVK